MVGGVLSGLVTEVVNRVITFRATNAGGTDDEQVNINVLQPPMWSTIPTQTFTVGDTVNVALSSYASGFPAPSFTATNLPAGLSVNITGNLVGTPTAVGTESVIITALNAGGAVQTTFDVTVEVGTVARFYGVENRLDRIRVWDSVDGIDDSLALNLGDGNWIDGALFGNHYYVLDDDANFLYVWDINKAKDYRLNISLGNGDWEGVFIHDSHIYVVDDNSNALRVWDSLSIRQSGMDISLGTGEWVGGIGHMNQIFVLNKSNNQFQVWDTDGTRQSGSDFSLGVGDWTGAFSYEGSETFAPSWLPLPSIRIAENTLLMYDVSSFASGSTPLTFSLGSGSPSWASITGGGLLSGTPTTAGDVTVPIIASNSESTATTDLTVEVESLFTAFLLEDLGNNLRANSLRDISLGAGTWEGGFAYNNHFYLVENIANTLSVWDSAGTRQSGQYGHQFGVRNLGGRVCL